MHGNEDILDPQTIADWLDPEGRPTYGLREWKAILDGSMRMSSQTPIVELFDVKTDGVYVPNPQTPWHEWHPRRHLEGRGDIGDAEPWLPFPFTARRLAASLLFGPGEMLATAFREPVPELDSNVPERGAEDAGTAEKAPGFSELQSGPDPKALEFVGRPGDRAFEALRGAFKALQVAFELARPNLEQLVELDSRVVAFVDSLRAARSRAGGRASGAIDAELANLKQARVQALREREQVMCQVRTMILQHLLLPFHEVPDSAFADPGLRETVPDQRAGFLWARGLASTRLDPEKLTKLTELFRQRSTLAREASEYRSLPPRSPQDLRIRNSALGRLGNAQAHVSLEIKKLQESLTQRASTPPPPPLERLATPSELIAAFGAVGLQLKWFRSPANHPWLINARVVKGRPGRSGEPPRYCPVLVMLGLQKSKVRLSDRHGWAILERAFPAAYKAHESSVPVSMLQRKQL